MAKKDKATSKENLEDRLYGGSKVEVKKGPTFVLSNGKKSPPILIARALRSLSLVMGVGESESTALEVVGEQFAKYSIGRQFARAAKIMREEGADFKTALFHENELIPKTARALIVSSPNSTALVENLKKAAEQVATGEDIKKKLKGAMMQPMIMLVLCIIFLFVAAAFIIPNFSAMFSSLAAEEPTASVIVKAAAVWVQWIVGVLIVLIILFLAFWHSFGKRNEKLRGMMDKISLKLPLAGEILKLSAVSRLFDMLALNLSIGYMEADALESAAIGTGNEAVRIHCFQFADRLRNEGTLQLQEFVDSNLFPPSARYMIKSSRNQTQMVELMNELSKEFKAEAATQVEGFEKAAGPLMTYFVYAIAGLLIIGIMVPLFSIYPALMDMGN